MKLVNLLSKMKKTVEDFCVPDALTSTKFRTSPSGRYMLVVETFETGKNTWSFTRGTVYNQESGERIASVCRNYHAFWECWAEDHPDGHDYMLCGKDYQGQTIIQLDTGVVQDSLPKEASQGWGFCWADVNISPDKTSLVVDGCYWGAPYEIRIYDFSDPMKMPYEVSKEFYEQMEYGQYSAYKWLNDEEILIKSEQDGRKSDGKLESEIPPEEFEGIECTDDEGFFEVLYVWNHNAKTLIEVGRKESNEDDWTWVEEAIVKFEKERLLSLS